MTPSPHGRLRRFLLVVLVVVSIATAASCGGDDDGANSDPTPAADPRTGVAPRGVRTNLA